MELRRDGGAIIVEVEESIELLLGWRPDDLIGRPSTELIHPADQLSAVQAWMEMLTAPGQTMRWRGRYQTSAGGWQWIESSNTNLLEDSAVGAVRTVMAAAEPDVLGIEEQLRAREQVFSQLADALPVGLVQVDADRTVTFTNAQLHTFVPDSEELTIESLVAPVLDSDRGAVLAAVDAALAGEATDDLEFRVVTTTGEHRVCSLSLRALSDDEGTITGAIGCVGDVTDRVQLRRQLEFRANVDGLTSCLNRHAVVELLDRVLRGRREDDTGVAVVFADLDGFKDINDTHGHAAGDLVLVAAAQRLRIATRGIDHVGRLGGDEFVVVCPAVASVEAATAIADRVRDVLHGDLEIDGGHIRLRGSVGVAFASPESRIEPDELIARADAAMYESKRQGRTAPPAA